MHHLNSPRRVETDKNLSFSPPKNLTFHASNIFTCVCFLQERRKSGVIMQATMTDDTRNKYMVRVDSKDFN